MNNRSPRRQKKQRQPNTTQQRQAQDPPPAPELAAFSLAAAIQEARTEQQQQQQPRSFFQKLTSSSPLKKKNFPSQASLATNTSFATANDATNTSFRTSAEEQIITPSAASYFVDSSDNDSDEETTESLTFGNDPLSVLSRNNIDLKPTEISFVDHQDNPEETITTTTMAKKKTSKITPTASAVVAESTPVPEATPTTTETTVVVSEEPHFDVAQTIYGTTKNIWAWGKTIPVISSILTLTEGATAKVLDVTIHMDLPSIDQDVVTPKAKELDDGVITPVICKIWELVGPAVGKGDEMIVKPFVGEVVPRVLGPLGLLGGEEKKVVVVEEKNVIDGSDNPEVVPPVALN